MPTLDSHPVLLEATEVFEELRRARRVAQELGPRSLAHEAVGQLQCRLAELLENAEHKSLISRALDECARNLRTAVTAWQLTQKEREFHDRARAVALAAATAGRPLLAAESAAILQLRGHASRVAAEQDAWVASRIRTGEERDTVFALLSRLRVREARTQLAAGLLLTKQMRDVISEALPALTRGEPLLLLGETGGAKTALAEYLALELMGSEPEFVSGYGDISSSQLIGSHELRPEQGATVSVFVPGPLLRAMTEGHPLILDEVNAMPPEFLKRLNRVLQLRPGDTFSVQENGGEPVVISPGFVILATANELTPHRYRGIDRMSAELINRFGANSYRIHYPDAGKRYSDIPEENALLAASAIADADGRVPLAAEELERVSRAAFISQQVFSGAHGSGFDDFVSTEREIDGRPGLEESVLAPRTLVAVLQKVTGSGGQVTLDRALTRFVEGVMHSEDREVLTLILRSQGFLKGR